MTNDLHIASIPKNQTEEIRVSIGEFNGHMLFNARVYYTTPEGDMKPGRAGIAFKIDKLADFADAVEAARLAALEKGLIS